MLTMMCGRRSLLLASLSAPAVSSSIVLFVVVLVGVVGADESVTLSTLRVTNGLRGIEKARRSRRLAPVVVLLAAAGCGEQVGGSSTRAFTVTFVLLGGVVVVDDESPLVGGLSSTSLTFSGSVEGRLSPTARVGVVAVFSVRVADALLIGDTLSVFGGAAIAANEAAVGELLVAVCILIRCYYGFRLRVF